MIKFFRHIRQKMLSENKFSKYLLYAIGEIVLVVIGILIALQVNNANENRKQRERAQGFLNKLKTQIDKNSARTQDYLEENTYYLDVSKKLLKQIDDMNEQINASQLDTLVLINAFDFHINLEMVVLEEGKGNGDLALVQPDSLRQSIYKFIKTYDDYKEREKVINEDLSINFKPFLIKHYNIRNLINTAGFEGLGVSVTPRNKALEIIKNSEFENYIATRIMLQDDMVSTTNELAEVLQTLTKQLNTVLTTTND